MTPLNCIPVKNHAAMATARSPMPELLDFDNAAAVNAESLAIDAIKDKRACIGSRKALEIFADHEKRLVGYTPSMPSDWYLPNQLAIRRPVLQWRAYMGGIDEPKVSVLDRMRTTSPGCVSVGPAVAIRKTACHCILVFAWELRDGNPTK